MKKQPKQTPPDSDGKAGQSPLSGPTNPPPLDIPLPAPMDLAKLAAILEPKATPRKAMTRAMEFFVEATCFLQECPRSLRELISCFGYGERLRALYFTYDPTLLTDTLELDVSKFGHDADPARKYLSERRLKVKTGRAVLNNWHLWLPSQSKEAIDAEIECYRRSKDIYAIPRLLLQAIASDNKRRRAESKRKGRQTRRAASETKSPKNTGEKSRQAISSVQRAK
jgi:hypothetical protein